MWRPSTALWSGSLTGRGPAAGGRHGRSQPGSRAASGIAGAMSALDAGDWDTARFRFESVLRARAEQTPEAWYGLGTALWWLGETGTAVRAQERAYSAFAQRPDPFGSALVAISLCMIYRASATSASPGHGWAGSRG